MPVSAWVTSIELLKSLADNFATNAAANRLVLKSNGWTGAKRSRMTRGVVLVCMRSLRGELKIGEDAFYRAHAASLSPCASIRC